MNKNIKKLILRVFLFLEVLIFGFTYLFSKNGIYQLKNLSYENKSLDLEIKNLKDEIISIENEINEWNTDSFYKEKMAREKLQLARENEKIYFLDKEKND